MSKKTLYVLFAVFMALGIIAAYPLWSSSLNFIKSGKEHDIFNFSSFTKNSVDKIVIVQNKAGKIEIVKEDGAWKVNGFDVAADEVNNFFKALGESKTLSLVSKNPNNHKKFSIDEKSGISLELWKGGDAIKLIVGKRGSQYDSLYIRMDSSDDVYLVSSTLRTYVSQDVSAWRDKTIVNIQKSAIQKIKIVHSGKSLVVERAKDGWQTYGYGKRAELSSAVADKFAGSFGPFEATGFLNKDEQQQFVKAASKDSIIIFTSNESPAAEIELLKRDTEWWAHVKGGGIFYKILSYKMNDISLVVVGGGSEN